VNSVTIPCAQPPGLAATLRSELVAAVRARSTRLLLLTALGVSVGLAGLGNFSTLQQEQYAAEHVEAEGLSAAALLGFSDPTSASLKWLLIALLPMMAFGAVGCIRGRPDEVMTGRPAPRALVTARVVTVAMIALIAGEVISLASFFVGELALGLIVTGSLARAADLRAVIGGGLFLAVGGMLGFGLAAVLRAIAPAISRQAVLALALAAWTGSWIGSAALPGQVARWFPFQVGVEITKTTPGPGAGPWAALAVFCAYTAVVVIAGLALAVRPRRRLPARWLGSRPPGTAAGSRRATR
jgi:ABC-2 type transport system permease protein